METGASIILSEAFPWPPHFQFTGDRCPETYGAICKWDETPLSGREKKILLLSQQTQRERGYLLDIAGRGITNEPRPYEGWSQGKKELMSRLHKVERLHKLLR